MPEIGDAALWSKFGLSGLVIFALFVCLIGTVVFMIKRFDIIDQRNIEASKDLNKEHKDERIEWREANYKQAEKFENAITRLTDKIKCGE